MKTWTAVAVVVLSLTWSGTALGVEPPPGAVEPKQEDGGGTMTREQACDCCQKCMAAMKKIEPKPDRKPAQKDGCRECCNRCGKEKKPSEEEFPPEIAPH